MYVKTRPFVILGDPVGTRFSSRSIGIAVFVFRISGVSHITRLFHDGKPSPTLRKVETMAIFEREQHFVALPSLEKLLRDPRD